MKKLGEEEAERKKSGRRQASERTEENEKKGGRGGREREKKGRKRRKRERKRSRWTVWAMVNVFPRGETRLKGLSWLQWPATGE